MLHFVLIYWFQPRYDTAINVCRLKSVVLGNTGAKIPTR